MGTCGQGFPSEVTCVTRNSKSGYTSSYKHTRARAGILGLSSGGRTVVAQGGLSDWTSTVGSSRAARVGAASCADNPR